MALSFWSVCSMVLANYASIYCEILAFLYVFGTLGTRRLPLHVLYLLLVYKVILIWCQFASGDKERENVNLWLLRMMIIELKRQHGFCLVDIGTWNFLFFLSSLFGRIGRNWSFVSSPLTWWEWKMIHVPPLDCLLQCSMLMIHLILLTN